MGLNAEDCTIGVSYATGSVTGGSGDHPRTGSLAGRNEGTIRACYVLGSVTGGSGSDARTGGLVGDNTLGGTIRVSYAAGSVTAGSGFDPRTGGLIGENAVSSSISDSYFDTDYSGQTNAIGRNDGTATNVEGKTTTELQTPTAYGTAMDIYANWNIDIDNADTDDDPATGTDDPWDFGTSSQYPALKVDIDGNGTATADEFGSQLPTRFLSMRYMFDIALGISVGSEVGTVVAVPADFNNTLSYTILSQTLNGAAVSHFVIANTAIGTISVADPAPTGGGLYTLSVEVSDGAGGTATTEVILNLLLLMSEGEFTTCSDKFTDTGGGSGDYGNHENITMTISPESAADRVRVEFTSFHVEPQSSCNLDRLEVYNGATRSAPLIGTYCGTNSPGVVLSSRDGKLTFRFQSDGADVFSGWEATISCVPAALPSAPTALTTTATNTAVTLSWDAPVNDGGATITGYMIEYSVNADFSSSTTVPTINAATIYTVSGLANATLYYFRVAAVNAVGTGAYYPGMGGTAVSATPVDNLIDVTTLEKLNAIRYDLDGDGVVSFTTADPLPAAADFSNRTAVVTLMGADSIYAQAFTSGDFYTAADGTAAATGAVAVSTAYYYKLSSMATSPYTGYELMNNLDFDNVGGSPSIWSENCTDGACQTATAVDGDNADKVGWAPLGDNSNTYTATFDGRGRTISNLYINRPSTSDVGLFGVLGTGGNVRNLGIEGGSLSGASSVGGLVGSNIGAISACYATGDASGSSLVGGLVGNNGGTISACYATGDATGTGNTVGGLVGNNEGTISACYATRDASGSSLVGGLVGNNLGTIIACYATGDATGTGSNVGGLVGNNSGTVTNSYFESDVSNRPALDSHAKTTTELQTPTAYGTSTDIYANWNIDVDDGLAVGVDDGTAAGDPGTDDPWDFGTSDQYPALKVDFDRDGASSVAEFGMRPRTVFRVSIFTPERGVVGATVTIRGRLFSTTAADNTVTFLGDIHADADNAEATVSTSPAPTTTSLTVTVPPNAQTGPISVMVGTAADTSSQDYTVLIGEDKDVNDNGLIEVSSLEQLHAIRYDLDGDGVPSGTDPQQAAYRTAFGLSGVGTAASCTGGCEGYELMNNLDFDNVSGSPSIWSENCADGACQTATAVKGNNADKVGWAPIGDNSNAYTATFEGNDYTISNLYINRASTDNVGLFGALGTGGNVRNLGIEGGSLSGRNRVGGLAGANNGGTITNSHATVHVTASQNDLGGLVGVNNGGTIRASYATGNVTGSGDNVGGLTGSNEGGEIRASYATGIVVGSGLTVGGLAGVNKKKDATNATIRASYAVGSVTAAGSGSNPSAGGLVGINAEDCTIGVSYAMGSVTGGSGANPRTGSLAGRNEGTISACYVLGSVTGGSGSNPRTGGLVGDNTLGGTIRVSYAAGSVTAGSGANPRTGGLIGENAASSISNSYFDTDYSGQTDAIGRNDGTATNVEGKTTTELQTPTAYGTAMDIYATWNIDVDNGQPIGVDDGTMAGDPTADDPWDFGTDSEYPALKVDFNVDGSPSVAEFGTQPRTVSLRVSSFTPERGVVGATVTIRGRAFGATATDNTVVFLGAEGDADNAAATVSAATATSLTVTVPPNAQTGPISVMVGTVADTSLQDFTVLIAEDKDANDNGLIEVSSLEQLHAMRYDLDGDGIPSGTDPEQAAYRTAFGVSGASIVVSCTGGCEGYELMNNLDFDNVSGSPSIWSEDCTDGACQTATAVDGDNADKVGWKPIGGSFTATFDGNNYAISNLYIDRSSTDNVGLFRTLGTGGNVRNLGIEGGSLSGNGRIGALVGANNGGTITNSHATVHVTASQNDVGGLVGVNNGGTITNSYAMGNVTGSGVTVGGLVGWNEGGTIRASYATGTVTGTGDNVGGLTGSNEGGELRASYATGTVTGSSDHVGGLAGVSKKKDATNATIRACYATGAASGSVLVGGLVGRNSDDCTIGACYATGNATGTGNTVGGLAGRNQGTISACYATGAASGSANVAGLVGYNSSTIIACYATGNATGTGSDVGGLVGQSGGTVTGSYFDSTVSNRTDSDDHAKTTTDLQTPMAYDDNADATDGSSIYETWNIDVDDGQLIGVDDGTMAGDATADDPWDFGTDSEYPVLRADFNVNGSPTAFEFGGQGRAVPATVPDALAALTATAANTAVTLSWTAAASDGAPITGYMIDYSVSAAFPSPTTRTTAATATSYTVSGLTNGTPYYFRVAAVNAAGTAAYYPGMGDAAVSATPATVPAAPSALLAMAANAAVTLSWDAPVNDGGAEITGYMIEHSLMVDFSSPTTATTMDAATSYTVSVLTNGTLYYFRVAAVNAVGTGAYYPGATDAAVSATPAPATPAAPLVVSSFTPEMGAVGEAVMITGTGFSTTATDNTVTFLGEEANDADNVEAIVSTSPAPTAASLSVSVPSTAQTGKISVMVGTAADTSAASFTVTGTTPAPAAPVVLNFSPLEGEVGISVTITGENFSDMPSENEVGFGGVMAADPTSASTTSLVVLVPSGAVTGRVSVTVGGQTGTSSTDFTVTAPAPDPPVVLSFSPSEGEVGISVTIIGENFSATASENEVRFGGMMAAAPTSASTTSLTVRVPSGARTGSISVAVGGQTGTSSTDFTVTGTTPALDPPVVLSFSPLEGEVGTSVTITGDNFSATASANEVRFGGVMAAEPTSASTTSLTVRVPSGARTGRISVAVGGQTGTSSTDFTVTGTTPEPTAFSVPLSSEGDVRVYPNPTSGQLHFKGLLAGGRYVCDLYSLVGQKVLSSVVRAGDMMDTSTLSSGQYILILQAEGRELMRTRLLVVR